MSALDDVVFTCPRCGTEFTRVAIDIEAIKPAGHGWYAKDHKKYGRLGPPVIMCSEATKADLAEWRKRPNRRKFWDMCRNLKAGKN